MATSSAQQQTFTLLLKAQDQATSAIQDVHGALQKLGAGTDLTDLSHQLHTLGTDMADVSRSMGPLTQAVETGMASAVAATKAGADEIVAALEAGLAEEATALKEGLAAQLEARKEAARQEEGAEREHEGLMSRLREHLERPIEFAKMAIGFEAGMAAISALTEGIHELPREFADAASAGEQFTTQMQNFYGSTTAAGQVLEYTNAQALKMPFSLEAIRQSVAALAATGQDAGRLLPALGNIATAMGTTLPAAVDVFNRALVTGNLRGLESQLHVSRETLESFGLAVDTHGKIIASTLAPALERLAQTRFGDAMARQSETLRGSLTQISNQLDLLKEVAGEALFEGMKGQFKGLIDWLNTHQADVRRFAQGVGESLAGLLKSAMAVGQWIAVHLGPPIVGAVNLIVAAWKAAQPAITAVIGVLEHLMAQLGTFLHDKVLPVVYQVLGQMVIWWNDHAKQIGQILSFLWGLLQTFWGSTTSLFNSALNEIHGIWEIGWGSISGLLSTVIDVMTGNFGKLVQDLKNMAGTMAMGIVDIFAGMVERVVGILGHMEDPLTGLSQAFFSFASGAAGALYNAFLSVQQSVVGVVNGVIDTVNGAITKLDQTFQSKTLSILNPLTHKRQVVGQTPGLDIGTVGHVAMPEADPSVLAWIAQLGQKRLTFGATGDQAVASIEKLKDTLHADIRQFLGMPTPQRETAAGQNLFSSILTLARGAGQKPPSFGAPGQGGLPGVLPGIGEGGTGAAATDASKALQDAYTAATKHLEADLERTMPLSVLLADRARIRGAMVALKDSADDIFLEMTSTMKSIQDHIHQAAQAAMDKAKQTLQYEEVLGLPYKVLKAQVDTIMKAFAQSGPASEVGVGTLAYRATYKQLIDEINKQGGGGTSPAVPSPAYGTYGGLATGYGQTTVSFGGTQQSGWAAVVAELRAQLAFWRSRALAEQRQLDAQQQTAHNTAQIARNTQGAADKMDQAGRGSAAAPVATAVRAVGGFQVMRRV